MDDRKWGGCGHHKLLGWVSQPWTRFIIWSEVNKKICRFPTPLFHPTPTHNFPTPKLPLSYSWPTTVLFSGPQALGHVASDNHLLDPLLAFIMNPSVFGSPSYRVCSRIAETQRYTPDPWDSDSNNIRSLSPMKWSCPKCLIRTYPWRIDQINPEGGTFHKKSPPGFPLEFWVMSNILSCWFLSCGWCLPGALSPSKTLESGTLTHTWLWILSVEAQLIFPPQPKEATYLHVLNSFQYSQLLMHVSAVWILLWMDFEYTLLVPSLMEVLNKTLDM